MLILQTSLLVDLKQVGQAIALLYVDNPISDKVIGALKATGVFGQAKALNFAVNSPNS